MREVKRTTPPPIETVSVERQDGRVVVVVRRGGIEATGTDQDEQTALFAARSAWHWLETAPASGARRYGRTKRRAGGTPTRAGEDAGATAAAPTRGTAGGMLAVRENEKTRGRDAHASRRGRRRYGGCADPWHGGSHAEMERASRGKFKSPPLPLLGEEGKQHRERASRG
ncbi:MAG: hypothetical protein M5U26_27115 [Planctomycetota bacterium]|nr:hypothetical protein [Planctomycetota bacterium]